MYVSLEVITVIVSAIGIVLTLGARIDALATEITDLKIAVARFEGPQRQLYVAGR
ncbi:hypothetical protein [Microbacterium sp. A93]|uniref:hypothetical protein n=1 Tax=Microbacterium sp. A93 TaxID=3450716 RepID=UPI003F427F01